MNADPFDRTHCPPIGQTEVLAPEIRVVTAPNAGPMTFTGTRSYILGAGPVMILDPGPSDAAHLNALAEAVAGQEVRAILITHSHVDHSAGAPALARRLGAPVLAHGDPLGARSAIMARLARDAAALGGGEGRDADFRPDDVLHDGMRLALGSGDLEVFHMPGHMSDHLCFRWEDVVFSGDLAMGWASTMISPPDGDLTAFRNSIERLRQLAPKRLYPGHGAPVENVEPLLSYLLAHRQTREDQILDAMRGGARDIPGLVSEIYADVSPALHGAAARNVLAHLIDLSERGVVTAQGGLPGVRTAYSLAS